MRSAIPFAFVAGIVLFGLLSRNTRSQEPSLEDLAGAYRNVEPDGGRATIEEQTDEGLSEARRVLRAMARPRILENNPPVRRLIIEIENGEARVTYEGGRSYHAPIGGPAVEQRAPDGGRVRVRYVADGDALVEIAEESRGSGRIRYERRGDELVVRTLIESSKLPAPIRFMMRFRPEQR